MNNRPQAIYAPSILKACGYRLVPWKKGKSRLLDLSKSKHFETMAEMEHGRWMLAKIKEGWRLGSPKDEQQKLNPCLLPWDQLEESVKSWDRSFIRKWPEIFRSMGKEIIAPPGRQAYRPSKPPFRGRNRKPRA